ncbi:Gfo/Idh/MocA family oxidoreductase [Singulisphaera sp. PoT]|uniref:Gfo/Idh/MocA family oxidoreductase n=1 Tax=Singulisphaera sp. PoT TaxID=3411797 RepID=UPI003BF529F5
MSGGTRRHWPGAARCPTSASTCLNASRYITGEEPIQVSAQILTDPNDPRFKEVEDRISFQLWFPSGVLAICQSFYSAHESRRCRVLAERGWIDLDPAFAYHGLRLKTSLARGETEQTAEIRLAEKNHFALEMDHMAERVAKGERPHTPGQEGLQDLRIIEAIYRAAREGRTIDLPAVAGKDTTRGHAPA